VFSRNLIRRSNEVTQGPRQAKKARYDALGAKDDSGAILTQLEQCEITQLYYELYPSHQYWRSDSPNTTPEDLYHAKANGSMVAG
jgi:hypothetical protein